MDRGCADWHAHDDKKALGSWRVVVHTGCMSSKKAPEEPEPIGRRIDQLREARGWSQARLAREVAIERTHLSRLLRGGRTFQVDQLRRVAIAVQMELADLVHGTDAEQMLAVDVNVQEENKRLAEQLASRTAEIEGLRARVSVAEQEKEILQKELREARASERTQSQKLAQLEHRFAAQRSDLQRELAGARMNVATLQARLQKAHEQVEKNYQAYLEWKNIAESRGAAMTVGAVGVGLLALLGSNR